MLTYPEFVATVQAAVPRFQAHWLNVEQDQAVRAPQSPPTFIVAGPGAGKTTVLVLRVLKLILVDQIPPAGIIATTFTRKAAGELRSRILSWGYATVNRAIQDAHRARRRQRERWLRDIDVNAITVGTLDSLAEQFLRDCRGPGEITPATIEGFLAKGLMRRHGIFAHARHNNVDLRTHVAGLTPGLNAPFPLSELLKFVLAFAGRVRHDGINVAAYAAGGAGQQVLCDAIADYHTYLGQHYLADFARLEQLLLEMLGTGQLAPISNNLRALLVDEFQDTNYQQEQIYLRLCQQSNASLTVVGDDDQSIFRFRGATVEIFANFQARIVAALGAAWTPNRVDLFRNYRSTQRVVCFCERFIQLDPGFHAARAPGKIPLVAQAPHAVVPNRNLPVLGMFRTDCQQLAADLASLLHDIFQGAGRQIQCQGVNYLIARGNHGDYGDSVLLSHSVRERTAGGRERLPLFLRQTLQNQAVRVFNPRGRNLGDMDDVQRLIGLALHCIDDNGAAMAAIPNLPNAVRTRLLSWRVAAQAYMATNPAPGGLQAFVHGWRTRSSGFVNQNWPRDWPILELVFTLVTWFPNLQTDPEGQVYLEAITRTISEVGQFASYRAQIRGGDGVHDAHSIRQAIWELFAPIADDDVDVDEEIMPHVPRNYFPLMTIHQAKGLEFPLVIVDVGSDFATNHHTQRRMRHPVQGDGVHLVEADIAPHCPVGALRTARPELHRAWDDIRRLYFVAYSRPENVLLLAGLISQTRANNPVPCISMGNLPGGGRGLQFIPATQWAPTAPPGTVALI
jgi:DNA helicase-2/ATP-dependent DNA helicase PcrA